MDEHYFSHQEDGTEHVCGGSSSHNVVPQRPSSHSTASVSSGAAADGWRDGTGEMIVFPQNQQLMNPHSKTTPSEVSPRDFQCGEKLVQTAHDKDIQLHVGVR